MKPDLLASPRLDCVMSRLSNVKLYCCLYALHISFIHNIITSFSSLPWGYYMGGSYRRTSIVISIQKWNLDWIKSLIVRGL